MPPESISQPLARAGDLSAVERRFCEEYIIDLAPGPAAARSGLDDVVGTRLLADPRIQAGIAAARAARTNRTALFANDVLRRWWLLANADPRELVQVRRGCCRHCYGYDHRYQFTPAELEKAMAEHRKLMMRRPPDDRVPFDDLGGSGYIRTLPPIEDCPECFGEGLPYVWVEDSRNYSPAAALLFDGAKSTAQGGVEIKFRSRDAALDKIAQYLGMLVERRAVMQIDPAKLSDAELDSVLKKFDAYLDEAESGEQAALALDRSPDK